MWMSILAVSLGASAGALFRWQLGVRFNPLFPTIPVGTLLANLIGGFLVGMAIGYLSRAPDLAPEWRLFIVTGVCGGLTTFSTFSAEVVALHQQGLIGWAFGAIAVHLIGSILMTFAGMITIYRLKGPWGDSRERLPDHLLHGPGPQAPRPPHG